ncbi:MAG: bifunctional DNA-formamidopyrimidine glycosylase/DNA-(apurinic or apyrimidinic site) lyase, partial [Lacisediminihabitans sp.]
MPELPEVEVVRAGLAPAVSGATVSSVAVLDERSLRRHPGPSEDFIDRLTDRRFTSAVRRGKFLWLPLLGSHEALVVHLGMSGQVLLRTADGPDDRLTRIRIELVSPNHGTLLMNFADQRIFGSMAIDDLVPTTDGRAAGYSGPSVPELDSVSVPEPVEGPSSLALIPQSVAHIARDPLDPAFDERRFYDALSKRHTGIKRALLDQNLISGIGNIYADESLWTARIHYDQPTNTLSRAKAKTILAEVRQVLAKALAEGGTSFDAQYVNVNGASGYFSHSLN